MKNNMKNNMNNFEVVLGVSFERYDDTLVEFTIKDMNSDTSIISDFIVEYEDETENNDNCKDIFIETLELYLEDEVGEDTFNEIEKYIKEHYNAKSITPNQIMDAILFVQVIN